MDLLNNIWQWVQGLSVFTVLAGISYKAWLPPLKEWITKKLDQRFAEQMQDADHAFQEKVRHVQYLIDRELDRARKLQDREFEALSRAWEILHETFWRTREATNRGYTVTDLAAMQSDQLEEFVTNLDFPGWRKKELFGMIHNGADEESIQKYYEKGWRTKQYSECEKRRVRFVKYVDRKGIFMQPEIKQRFDTMQQLIADALLEFQLRIRDTDAPVNRFNEHIQSDALRATENGLYAELETMIRKRLWSPVQPSHTVQQKG